MAMGGNAMRSPHRHYLDWIATVGLSIDGRGECGGKVRRGRRIDCARRRGMVELAEGRIREGTVGHGVKDMETPAFPTVIVF